MNQEEAKLYAYEYQKNGVSATQQLQIPFSTIERETVLQTQARSNSRSPNNLRMKMEFIKIYSRTQE